VERGRLPHDQVRNGVIDGFALEEIGLQYSDRDGAAGGSRLRGKRCCRGVHPIARHPIRRSGPTRELNLLRGLIASIEEQDTVVARVRKCRLKALVRKDVSRPGRQLMPSTDEESKTAAKA